VSDDRAHWEAIHGQNDPDELSWFEPAPRTSLAMIDELDLRPDVPIVDVGGGTSRLARELVTRGHTDVTVADLSGAALERARNGFTGADRVTWVVADVRTHDFGRRFALWHDRAVFHFMVGDEDRHGYLATLERSVEPGGHVILATFGPDGPTRCSGLPVTRYGAAELAAELGGVFELRGEREVSHTTPSGADQAFVYASFRRQLATASPTP
jgi:SAM-dependent methyltransferase